jgi:hypothetical protein
MADSSIGEVSRKVSADERRSPPMRWLGETSTSSTMTLSFVSRLPRIGRGTKVVRYRTVGAAVGRVKPNCLDVGLFRGVFAILSL